MSYKVYITEWIPELGRFAIITTALQINNSRNMAGEAFVFALDEENAFDGKRITYKYSEVTERWVHVDKAYMHNEALSRARCIISLKKGEAYRKTKNISIYRSDHRPIECESISVVLLELRDKYEEKLKELSQESISDELKQIISAFLKIKISVEPL